MEDVTHVDSKVIDSTVSFKWKGGELGRFVVSSEGESLRTVQ